MIKKIILFIALIFVISGCGIDIKKDAQNLNIKYENKVDNTFYSMFAEMEKVDDWSPELAAIGEKYKNQLLSIAQEIEKEETPEGVIAYKTAFKEYCLAEAEVLRLASNQISAPESKQAEIEKLALTAIDNVPQKYYEAQNEYAKIITGKPATVLGVNGKNYLAYTVSNVDFIVTDITTKNEIGSNPHLKKKPIGKFLLVKVFVRNNQKDAITVDSNNFKIVDNEKREYSVSTEGQTTYYMENDTGSKGFFTQLNPNMGTEFVFVFDVPQNLRVAKLQARGGFSGKAVTIPLRKVIIQRIEE